MVKRELNDDALPEDTLGTEVSTPYALYCTAQYTVQYTEETDLATCKLRLER